jgi:hypothetical protein
MADKKYVILWEEPGSYWQGGGYIGSIQEAKKYLVSELPGVIQNRMLYKIGFNAPLSWKYVSTCGKCATIKEFKS